MSLRWNAIRSALEARTALLTSYQIAWPGRSFTPPNTGSWIKPTMIPATVDSAMTMVGDTHERGIFQVSIFVATGQGEGPLFAAADAISNHFDRVQLAGTGVTVQCGVPTPGPVIQDPDWLHLPVSIDFTAL